MPEYLTPGVYIEETSFRTKTIEGVSTSTAGFVGPARFGPVSGQPELVTSLADFQRIYGDLEDLVFTDQANPIVNYLAHAVRAFFEEGGRRLFVQRVFNAPRAAGFDIDDGIPGHHYALADTETDSFAGDMLADASNQLAVATQIATDVAGDPPSAEAQAAAEAARDAWQAAVDFLTDLDNGDPTDAGDVTNAATELGTARASLATAQGNLDTAQSNFDTNPTPVNADALADAVSSVDIADDAVDSAEAAWVAATTAQQIEQIQPGAGEEPLHLIARFPGAAGNMRVNFTLRVGNNVYQARPTMTNPGLNRLRDGALVHLRTRSASTDPWELPTDADPDGLMIANYDQAADLWTMNGVDATGTDTSIDLDGTFRNNLGSDEFEVRPVSVIVSVERPLAEANQFDQEETLGEYNFEPERRTSLLNTFTANPENRFDALTIPVAILMPSEITEPTALDIVRNLMAAGGLMQLLLERATVESRYTLAGGDDGALPTGPTYAGDPDFEDLTDDVLQMPLNGFLAFEGEEEISIVAAPGYAADRNEDDALGIQNAVVNHCERMRYRVAVLETPEDQTVTEALDFRNLRSSEYAALYYPWVTVIDPRPSQGGRRLNLPPSGFMAGIYARNDIEHAVFKAPANEVVRLAVDFEVRLNQAQQDVLNPNGVNCLRFFEGRGFLVWGARTVSDDPEWKYISVRRYFAYLERSIDRSTQWAVFENNGPELWGKIRRSVEDFLYNEWVSGGLLGAKPEQAYFVRCDRSTMTQNDLDNGRLICLVGVAPVKPAEFVIFRIGQWTADADR